MTRRRPASRSITHALWLAACFGVAVSAAAADRAPNELGQIMILVYHEIGEPEGRWARTPAHFRRDLEQLWEHGYRLVGLDDVLDGRIDVPVGLSPVVLTFDDSSPGQFRYVERNGRLAIAPDCAVGILEAFFEAHPDFGLKATFFVLSGAAQPHRLFGQPEHEERKLKYLVKRGFEVGNHTLWHADLSKYAEATVKRQLALAQRAIQQLVPGYRLRALALPMGAYPRRLEWAIRGRSAGVSYEHDAILMVAGGATPSPFSRGFDPYRLPRIQAVESGIGLWLGHFDERPQTRFVSDGDPATVTVPKGRQGDFRRRTGWDLRFVERD